AFQALVSRRIGVEVMGVFPVQVLNTGCILPGFTAGIHRSREGGNPWVRKYHLAVLLDDPPP
ncbi:MAG: hypothetical protein U1F50_22530, partial [Rubrivivax sp.]